MKELAILLMIIVLLLWLVVTFAPWILGTLAVLAVIGLIVEKTDGRKSR